MNFVKNLGELMVLRGINLIISFLPLVLIHPVLSENDIGYLVGLNVITSFIGGLDLGMPFRIARSKHLNNADFSVFLIWHVFISIVTVLSYSKLFRLDNYFWALAILSFNKALFSVVSQIAIKQNRIKVLSTIAVLSFGLKIFLIVYILNFEMDSVIHFYLYGFSIISLLEIALVIYLFKIIDHVNIEVVYCFIKNTKENYKFILLSIVGFSYSYIDRFMISKFEGLELYNEYSELAMYFSPLLILVYVFSQLITDSKYDKIEFFDNYLLQNLVCIIAVIMYGLLLYVFSLYFYPRLNVLLQNLGLLVSLIFLGKMIFSFLIVRLIKLGKEITLVVSQIVSMIALFGALIIFKSAEYFLFAVALVSLAQITFINRAL